MQYFLYLSFIYLFKIINYHIENRQIDLLWDNYILFLIILDIIWPTSSGMTTTIKIGIYDEMTEGKVCGFIFHTFSPYSGIKSEKTSSLLNKIGQFK